MSLENSIINGIYTSYVFVLYFKYIKTRSLFFIKHDITIFILELKKKNPYIHVIKSKQYCSINLKSLKILKHVDINIHEQNLRKCHIYFLRFTKTIHILNITIFKVKSFHIPISILKIQIRKNKYFNMHLKRD